MKSLFLTSCIAGCLALSSAAVADPAPPVNKNKATEIDHGVLACEDIDKVRQIIAGWKISVDDANKVIEKYNGRPASDEHPFFNLACGEVTPGWVRVLDSETVPGVYPGKSGNSFRLSILTIGLHWVQFGDPAYEVYYVLWQEILPPAPSNSAL